MALFKASDALLDEGVTLPLDVRAASHYDEWEESADGSFIKVSFGASRMVKPSVSHPDMWVWIRRETDTAGRVLWGIMPDVQGAMLAADKVWR